MARLLSAARGKLVIARPESAREAQGADADHRVLLVECAVLAAVAPRGERLSGVDIAVQRDGGFLACRNRVYRELRAGVAVAADKDVRLRSLIGQAVGLGGVLLRGFERTDVKRTPVNSLAYCADDAVYLNDLKFSGADWLAASPLVRLAKLHLHNLDALYPVILIGQDFYQRLLSAKNERIAKTGCIIAGCILMAMGVNSAIDGMLARAFLGDTLTEVSAIASLAVEVLPTVAAGIVIAALCAAVMSTADSLLLACTSHVVNDIYLGAMGKSASDEKSSKTILRMSVVTTVVVGIASLFVALAIPGIIEILDYAYTFYASGLVAPVLLGLFWKKGNALAAVSSIVVGGVVSLLCVFGILPIPVDAIIVGMSASFIDYVVVALVTGKKEG